MPVQATEEFPSNSNADNPRLLESQCWFLIKGNDYCRQTFQSKNNYVYTPITDKGNL